MIFPTKKKFIEFIKYGKIYPLYLNIPYSTPYSIYECLASPNSFLFESVKGHEKIARYSFIGFEPCMIFKIKNGKVEIESSYKRTIRTFNPLTLMKTFINLYSQEKIESLPPFQGGLAGIISYDFVHYIEKLPSNSKDDINLPDAHMFMIDKLIAFDHMSKQSWIIVCPGVREAMDGYNIETIGWDVKYDEALYIIYNIKKRLENIDNNYELSFQKSKQTIEIIYEMKKHQYIDIVKRAKDYIAAGDIFQANLSQRVSACIKDKEPWKLYRILRSINPSPFAAFVDFDYYKIVSSSPERLLRVKDRNVDTRPIAGTRPRGRDSSEDEFMREELILNEKERAEHIMLIDLERNDLGRVSEYGTVNVDELMITEDYSHVIHIVSNIKGRLSANKDCFSVINAAFPGGTITGVPKVRCMEIIDELEPVKRGPYTGSLGYISFTGNMDLNIIIRTFVIKEDTAYVQVGAGIVADSDPEREYYETLKKAEALIRTLEQI